ncbi:endonuclease domain-containing protein [Nocardiopsis sp. CC223A]|uniref:endonuclease domain-containing protein n=1 Tax=Nocardiopsis sp. CC223A TaxID=3044051 RepID=UPI00278BDA00|nr:hypothetical protein [Nocardiopsis sp. CC223A]
MTCDPLNPECPPVPGHEPSDREPLPDREPLLRTLRPIVPVLSPDAVVRGLTAAYLWGVDLTAPEERIIRLPPRVALPPGTPLRGLPVAVRREVVPPVDRVAVAGIPVTSAARTAAEVTALAPSVPVATARIDAFLARGLVDPGRVLGHRHLFTGTHAKRLCTAVGYASPLSQSPAESWLRAVIRQAGLPPPLVQCPVPVGPRTLHADLGWPCYRLAVEYDSELHHHGPRPERRDRARYTLMRAADWQVVPVTIHMLQCHTPKLLTRIRDELFARGWSCPQEHRDRMRLRIRGFGRRPPRLR